MNGVGVALIPIFSRNCVYFRTLQFPENNMYEKVEQHCKYYSWTMKKEDLTGTETS